MSTASFLRTLFTACVVAVLAGAWFASGQGEVARRDGLLSVRQFGAKGDGQADDTAAIQRAVDEGTGGLHFPRGTYRLTKTVLIDLAKCGPTSLSGDGTARIVMAGAGPAFKFIGHHEGTAAPKSFKPETWDRERTPMVDALEIVGEHPQSEGVWVEGTMQVTLTRLVVRKALHGVRLFGRNRNVIVSECHLYENSGIGLLLDQLNLHQINVTNTHISYNKQGGLVVRDSEIRNIHVGTCDIEANHDEGGPPSANVFFDCTKGSVREGAIVGCTIQHTNHGPDSANIRFLGRAEEPLKVGNFAIADNVFSDAQVGVELKWARGVTITGNSFWQHVRHNLLVEGSSHIVATGNLFDRNPDYNHQPFNTKNAIEFVDCQDCTLSANHIARTLGVDAGLMVRRSKRFNIVGCTILDCPGAGLLLDQVEYSRVSDCLIRDDRPAAERGAEPPVVAVRITGKGNQLADNLLGGKQEVAAGSVE